MRSFKGGFEVIGQVYSPQPVLRKKDRFFEQFDTGERTGRSTQDRQASALEKERGWIKGISC
jgi:hypothetical protein